jgi:hypothetical protein
MKKTSAGFSLFVVLHAHWSPKERLSTGAIRLRGICGTERLLPKRSVRGNRLAGGLRDAHSPSLVLGDVDECGDIGNDRLVHFERSILEA